MDLEGIALRLMTTGRITEEQILEDWDYRRGKSISDIVKVQDKAKKAGNYKTEFEIEWCELYLKDVLKKKRKW
jgi:hypothetical protein